MLDYRRILIKISGEALSDGGIGKSRGARFHVAKQLKEIVGLGVQVGVVVGGGNFWRGRTNASMDRSTADSIGMLATVMNGLTLGAALTNCGVDNRVVSALSIDKAVGNLLFTRRRKIFERWKDCRFRRRYGFAVFFYRYRFVAARLRNACGRNILFEKYRRSIR